MSYATFNAEFPCDETQYITMHRDETQAIIDSNTKYRERWAVAGLQAEERLLLWARSATDYRVSDLPWFIASHRRACVWAVLVGLAKSNNGRKENHESPSPSPFN